MPWPDEVVSLTEELRTQLEQLSAVRDDLELPVLHSLVGMTGALYADLRAHVPEMDPLYEEELDGPRYRLDEVRAVLRKLQAVDELPTELRDEVEAIESRLLADVEAVVDRFMKKAPDGDFLVPYYRELLSLKAEARNRRAQQETVSVLADARKAANAVREVAGVATDAVLAREFGEYASRERKTANQLRFAATAVVVLIVLAAALVVLRTDFSDLTLAEELGRLALTLPLAALAAYFGRESSRHRDVATWAQGLHVQLRTIDAYCESLADEADRNTLRLEFGRRLFTDGGVRATSSNSPSIAGETALLSQPISEVLRSTGTKAS